MNPLCCLPLILSHPQTSYRVSSPPTGLLSSFVLQLSKCSVNVVSRITGLGAQPNSRRMNHKVIIATIVIFLNQCSHNESQSSLLIPICKTTCLTSPRRTIVCIRIYIKISSNSGCKASPVFRQPYNEGWLLPSFADASKTICILVHSAEVLITALWSMQNAPFPSNLSGTYSKMLFVSCSWMMPLYFSKTSGVCLSLLRSWLRLVKPLELLSGKSVCLLSLVIVIYMFRHPHYITAFLILVSDRLFPFISVF